jgi:hypothetical protein
MDKTQFYILKILNETESPRTKKEIYNEIIKEITAPNFDTFFNLLESQKFIEYTQIRRIKREPNCTVETLQYIITNIGKIKYKEFLKQLEDEDIDKQIKELTHKSLKQSVFGTYDWWKLAIWTGVITAVFSITVSVTISKCTQTQQSKEQTKADTTHLIQK